MERSKRVVAVGLLCQRDLEVLGAGFKRAYPVENVSSFDHLLKAIDAAEARSPGEPEQGS